MNDHELLLAISKMMDKKFEANHAPIYPSFDCIEERLDLIETDLNKLKEEQKALEKRVTSIEKRVSNVEERVSDIEILIEREVEPRLNKIESCYAKTYMRYKIDSDRMEAAFMDIPLMKKVLCEHSEKLYKTS